MSEQIKEALALNVQTIITVFPNGIAYSIPIGDFIMNSIRWTQKEGTVVRSISIHEYKRFADLVGGEE